MQVLCLRKGESDRNHRAMVCCSISKQDDCFLSILKSFGGVLEGLDGVDSVMM